jgi:hypothetical protein
LQHGFEARGLTVVKQLKAGWRIGRRIQRFDAVDGRIGARADEINCRHRISPLRRAAGASPKPAANLAGVQRGPRGDMGTVHADAVGSGDGHVDCAINER